MRVFAMFVGMVAALAAVPASTREQRVALVIGNNAYDEQAGGLRPLRNAWSDAELISASLERAGFDVESLPNADSTEMTTAIKGFKRRLKEAGEGAVGVFYFAGHGLQARSRNYLMAVDASVDKPDDIPASGVEADHVLSYMLEGGARMNILLLDACRPNDVAKDLRPVAQKGFSQLDARGSEDRSVVMVYSTGLGENAADGDGPHGPFAAALADNMLTPNLSLDGLFNRVRQQMKGSGQRPWVNGTWDEFAFVSEAETSAKDN